MSALLSAFGESDSSDDDDAHVAHASGTLLRNSAWVAGLLRVVGCTAALALNVYGHLDHVREFYVLWLPSLALQVAYKGWKHGRPAALSEATGATYDFVRPFRACVDAWHDANWRESYQRLMIALVQMNCHFTSYGPICATLRLVLWAPVAHLVSAVQDQHDFFGGIPPALLVGFIVANLIIWQMLVVAVNLSHHRLYSHRSFTTSRPVAFCLGVLGCAATQRGPLWWSSNHRRHHKFCETALDPHCPALQGFFYAHCGWLVDRANFPLRPEYCGDWIDRPELLLLDAHVELVSTRLLASLATSVLRFGARLAAAVGAPASLKLRYLMRYNTDSQMISVALALHWNFLVNSWCHTHTASDACKRGPCEGLAIPWVGLLSGGEGFHNRHHQNARSARHAEHARHDLVYLATCALEELGLVWDVQRGGERKDD
jgi:stearoyl-CoA desaturase (delta-9 desaturase)